MKELKYYNLNINTLEYFERCFSINESPKRKEDIIWQYFENPSKDSEVIIAFDEIEKRTAGIYASSHVPMSINGKIVQGSQSLNTLTDINYRGKGLFTKLAKEVYKKSNLKNVSLIYGFPNGNSIHGFTKKLLWKSLDPVPFLIKPLKTKYFTSKFPLLKYFPNINLGTKKYSINENWRIMEESVFCEEIDLIWKCFSENILVSVNRDTKYLKWRYIDKPNENYRIAHIRNYEGKLYGTVVFCIKEKHDGKIGYVMELIYDVNKPTVGNLLLNYACTEIKKSEADCILAWCMKHSPNFNAFKSNMFFQLPEIFRPIELHFGVRAFDEDIKEIIQNRENWYLSYSDSDTV